ncbi:MAG: hypothetical protein K2F81_03605 [Ruminococcus sp.]|nr:hypothetical protein [Ruminococcus sp.]
MNGVIIFIVCAATLIAVIIIRYMSEKKNKCKKVGYILVPCDSNTKNLEKLVKSYYWEEVFENENMGREILLVIMENSENDYTAKRLASEYSIVSVVDITDLEDYLKKIRYSCQNLK